MGGRRWTWLMLGLALIGVSAATVLAPTPGHGQTGKIYPTNAQCTEGYPPDTVFIHACPTETTYFCPLSGRYGWNTMCVPLDPAALKARREADARAAEAALARQKMIDERLKSMGPGRQKEAERFVDMKIAADKARPQPPPKKRCICNMKCGTPRQIQLQAADDRLKAEGKSGVPVCPQ